MRCCWAFVEKFIYFTVLLGCLHVKLFVSLFICVEVSCWISSLFILLVLRKHQIKFWSSIKIWDLRLLNFVALRLQRLKSLQSLLSLRREFFLRAWRHRICLQRFTTWAFLWIELRWRAWFLVVNTILFNCYCRQLTHQCWASGLAFFLILTLIRLIITLQIFQFSNWYVSALPLYPLWVFLGSDILWLLALWYIYNCYLLDRLGFVLCQWWLIHSLNCLISFKIYG